MSRVLSDDEVVINIPVRSNNTITIVADDFPDQQAAGEAAIG